MLVLRRNVNEVILIGDDIRIVLIECRHGTARIGIDAPAGVEVDRLEIRERKEKAKKKLD